LPVFPATLFDYNGVLANDETVHLAAFQDALAPLGVSDLDMPATPDRIWRALENAKARRTL